MSDDVQSFLAAATATAQGSYAGNKTIVYARDPNEGTDPNLAARNLFPAFNFALSYQNVVRTTTMDLKRFPEATRSTFAAIGLGMAKAIDEAIPAYYVSTEFCSKGFAKHVREFAAGGHLIGQDPASHILQRIGLAKATVVDSATEVPTV